MSDLDDSDGPTEMDSVLRRGMQTESLSAEALQRIRSATEAEWRARTIGARQPVAWLRYASAAALICALAISWLLLSRNSSGPQGAVMGRLERADYPGVIERHTWLKDRPVTSGELLRSGQDILARGGARISLPAGGSVRIAPGTGVEVLSDQLLKVIDGSVYVDIPPASSRDVRFAVQTPAGTFTHVGTQFQIAVQGGQTQVRVREGQVRWRSAAGDVVSEAGTRLVIDPQGKVTTDPMAVTGASWGWAEALASAFVIENQSLAEFLRNVGRETGRKIIYSDAQVEQRAEATILHGSIQEFTAVEALSAVMATTSLRFTLEGDSIRIESGSDPEKKVR